MSDNEIRKRIKSLLVQEDLTLTDLVQKYNERYPDNTTTRQNLTNKLARQTLQFKEVIDLLNCLDYDVVFKKRT